MSAHDMAYARRAMEASRDRMYAERKKRNSSALLYWTGGVSVRVVLREHVPIFCNHKLHEEDREQVTGVVIRIGGLKGATGTVALWAASARQSRSSLPHGVTETGLSEGASGFQ